MHLKTVFIRFYKSFNYDYLRKNHPKFDPHPWDLVGKAAFPYVTIPIDSKVTTVVGANESGKSHLLTAIEKAISGKNITHEDLCRYSEFFKTGQNEVRLPDFGIEWQGLSDPEKTKVREICKVGTTRLFDSFLVFRTDGVNFKIYLPNENTFTEHPTDTAALAGLFPRTFRINPEIALPDSVPIRELIKGEVEGEAPRLETLERERRFKAVEAIDSLAGHDEWFSTKEKLAASAASVQPIIFGLATLLRPDDKASKNALEMRQSQVNLARDLLCKVAKNDLKALHNLYNGIRLGREGYVNTLIREINSTLAVRLNFPRVWAQDREFALAVSPREHDLVFTILDRTGREYSFNERSSGLKYFLSYYIQYLAHEPEGSDVEILLMDEPDAYLSSQAQQDMLRIFKAFSEPEPGRRPVQVIYVTHSPFLIDKNRSDRIRVLEKGTGDEGTRVVKDASRNHYEPLRSAFGAFLAETTFIGNCNLMVEGTGDQILLGGATAYLRSRGTPDSLTLDLNRITIVPAGGAPHVPYLVYLARGRDIERPSVIVLLDSDRPGDEAKTELKKWGTKGKTLIKDEFILQVGEISGEGFSIAKPGKPVEIEDMIPLGMCVRAAQCYAKEFWGAEEAVISTITPDAISAKLTETNSIFDAVKACVQEISHNEYHINKIGFARAVIEQLPKVRPDGALVTDAPPEISLFEANMKLLFQRLADMQRKAEKENREIRASQKIDRLKKGFIRDHSSEATREQANWLLQEITDSLDDSMEGDLVKNALQTLRRDHNLTDDVHKPIADFEAFKADVERVKYSALEATQENGGSEQGRLEAPVRSQPEVGPPAAT